MPPRTRRGNAKTTTSTEGATPDSQVDFEFTQQKRQTRSAVMPFKAAAVVSPQIKGTPNETEVTTSGGCTSNRSFDGAKNRPKKAAKRPKAKAKSKKDSAGSANRKCVSRVCSNVTTCRQSDEIEQPLIYAPSMWHGKPNNPVACEDANEARVGSAVTYLCNDNDIPNAAASLEEKSASKAYTGIASVPNRISSLSVNRESHQSTNSLSTGEQNSPEALNKTGSLVSPVSAPIRVQNSKDLRSRLRRTDSEEISEPSPPKRKRVSDPDSSVQSGKNRTQLVGDRVNLHPPAAFYPELQKDDRVPITLTPRRRRSKKNVKDCPTPLVVGESVIKVYNSGEVKSYCEKDPGQRQRNGEASSIVLPSFGFPVDCVSEDVSNRVSTPVRRRRKPQSLHSQKGEISTLADISSVKTPSYARTRSGDFVSAETSTDSSPRASLITCDKMRTSFPTFQSFIDKTPFTPDTALHLSLPGELIRLKRLYEAIEQAWKQRRQRHQPMLYSYTEGVESFKHHIERLSHCNLTLQHLRKLSWLAPRQIALQWKLKPRFDVHAPAADHWDVEICPLDYESDGKILLRALTASETSEREKIFAKNCLLWVKARHDEFLATDDPPIPIIPFESLSSWHPNFRVDEDHVPVPEIDFSVKCWQTNPPSLHRSPAIPILRGRAANVVQSTAAKTPVASPASFHRGVETNHKGIPLRLTSPSPMFISSMTPNNKLHFPGTPVRFNTPSRGRPFAKSFTHPSPNNSASQTPGLSNELSNLSLSTPFSSRRRSQTPNKYHSTTMTPIKGQVPSLDNNLMMTPERRNLLERTKLREREKHIEQMLRQQCDQIEEGVKSAEVVIACYEECLSIFLRSERPPMMQLPSLCKQIFYQSAGRFPRIEAPQDKLGAIKKGIEDMSGICPNLLSFKDSKSDKGVKVVHFRRDGNFAEEKKKLQDNLELAKECAAKRKEELVNQLSALPNEM